MKADLHYFETFDGLKLYYEHWIPDHPEGLLVIVHGLGDHSGRYGPLVRYFFQRNFAVGIYDQRGHGHSEGARGDCKYLHDFLHDLAVFVQKSKSEVPNVPLYLLGHSFGGQVVVNFVVRFSKGIRGIILSSPSFEIKLEIPKWKKRFGELGEKWLPRLKFGFEIDPNDLSHDEKVVERYKSDPLVFRRVSLRLAREIVRSLEIIMPMATRLYIPSLFLHGGSDKICDSEGTKKFFARVPIAQKQLKIYTGMNHEILNEVDNERVFNDIYAWICEQMTAENQIARGRQREESYEEDSFLNLGI